MVLPLILSNKQSLSWLWMAMGSFAFNDKHFWGYGKHLILELVGTLSPADLTSLELCVNPDADWNGEHSTTKSTSGLHCEVVGTMSGNCFPVCWKASYQTATSSSSAESETCSASAAIRHVALPVQLLLQAMLQGQRVPIRCKIDNTQAIAAIKKGYSKKLRCLARTHRVNIGA